MPIVIDRATGKIVSMPQYTQEQKDAAWDVAIRHFFENCPEEVWGTKEGT